MLFRIPLTVMQTKSGYSARPVFFRQPGRDDDNLSRLFHKLTRDLIQHLESLAKSNRHDELARWTFAPSLTTHRLRVEIQLRKRIVPAKYFVITFEHWGRRLAFTTAVSDLWFEVQRGEQLEARTALVMTEYWRHQEREADDRETVAPEAGGLAGKAWVQLLDIPVRTLFELPKTETKPFLMFGATGTPDGADELRRVGRCLDWLYPEQLDRATLRETEVVELVRLLTTKDRRPILLIGPRQCGKSAVIHEAVYRRVTEKKPEKRHRSNVWLVSPQRLISGMSYVGQWEGRLLAILRHARKRDHILYFDDLVGLFLAGQTSQTTLNVAMVLKPYLEQRRVRLLGEITPEQFQVLQERDRGFADLFHVIPIREPNEPENLRILIELQRRLEGQHNCDFDLEVLPGTIDLTRRYDRTAAFPGKAAAVLARLAVRAAKREGDTHGNAASDPMRHRPQLRAADLLQDFSARSGLSQAFLDPQQRLDRDDIRDQLARLVLGQPEVVEALADVVSIAKARLNDPERPLASFLLLGPTGVGKTECAKAVARVLFGDAERLLRIDLNEFNQPGSAARLVGTFQQPEGMLTSAVRRQPFAVILLDEIEKADRDVFDVLLQVLGEGRLTDALGRTADFTNCIILMTSNLGVREAEGQLGFGGESDRSGLYRRTAEKFFRPEFFNRLDRVIPFQKLSRDVMTRIADRLVQAVLAREGFAQRHCVMNVTPAAIDRVIAIGYDPALGARAMKRAVEQQLTRPAAGQLAGLDLQELTVVTVRAGDVGLSVTVTVPGFVPRLPPPQDRPASDGLEQCLKQFDSLEELLDSLRPRGPVSGRLTAQQERYFSIKERADAIAVLIRNIEDREETARLARLEIGSAGSLGRRPRYKLYNWPKNWASDGCPALRIMLSAFAMEEAIEDMFNAMPPVEDDELRELDHQLALVRLMAEAPQDQQPTYLWIRGRHQTQNAHELAELYLSAWGEELGVETTRVRRLDAPASEIEDVVLKVSGIHARPLAQTEAGTHLFLPKHGGPVPVRVDVVDHDPAMLVNPEAFGPIVRVYPENKPIADVRTNWAMPRPWNASAFRAFTLAALARNPAHH